MLARPVQIEVWFSEALLRHDLYPTWRAKVEREGARVVRIPSKLNGLCVFDRFEGVFEELANNRTEPYRILGLSNPLCGSSLTLAGLPCLLACLKRGSMPVFDDNLTPIYSLALDGFVMCSTGTQGDELQLLKRRAQYLGARFTLELSLSNTHLLASQACGLKFAVAAEHKRPILRPAYVRDTWMEQEKDPTTPLVSLSEAPYIISPFAHLFVCPTALSESRKIRIEEEAKRVGAGFSRDLTKQSTHLIAPNGKRSEKTTAAMKWRTPLVTPAWWRDSVAQGAPLPIAKYRAVITDDGESDASSRVSGSEASTTRSPPRALAKLERMDGVEQVGGGRALQVTPVDAALQKQQPKQIHPPPMAQSLPSAPTKAEPLAALSGVRFACVGFEPSEVCDISAKLTESGALLVALDQHPTYLIAPHGVTTPNQHGARLVTTQFIQRCLESSALLPADQCFIFSPLPVALPCDIFASVAVYTHGYSDVEMRSIALAAKSLGARHFRRIAPAVTHVVCRGAPPPTLPPSVSVVSPHWMLQSAIEGRLLPPVEFPPEMAIKMDLVTKDPAAVADTAAAVKSVTSVSVNTTAIIAVTAATAGSATTDVAAAAAAAAKTTAVGGVPPASMAAPASVSLSAALECLMASTVSDHPPNNPPPLRSRLRTYAPLMGRAATRAALEDDETHASPPPSQTSAFMDVRYDAPLRMRGSSLLNSPPKSFLFSCISGSLRSELEEGVRKLRGDVVVNTNWSDNVTHVVTTEFRNTLKIMCAIAAGRWIVPPSYVQESIAAGSWLAESAYVVKPADYPEHADLISSYGKWRLSVAEQKGAGKKGVFRGWRVLLLLRSQWETYSTLLSAGGATLVERDAKKFFEKLAQSPRGHNEMDLAVLSEDAEERASMTTQEEQAREAGLKLTEPRSLLGYVEGFGGKGNAAV